jgi:hypothetical protein
MPLILLFLFFFIKKTKASLQALESLLFKQEDHQKFGKQIRTNYLRGPSYN